MLISNSMSIITKNWSFSSLLLLLRRSECPQIHIFHFIARDHDLKKSLFPKPACEPRRKMFILRILGGCGKDQASNQVRSKVIEDCPFDFFFFFF